MTTIPPVLNTAYLSSSVGMIELQAQEMMLNASFALMNFKITPPVLNLSNPFLSMPTFNFNYSSSSSSRRTLSSATGYKSGDLLSVARRYIGYNEKDGSYLRFTNGRREAWCADFVSYCAREAGINGPKTSSVEGIRQWGKANERYSTTNAKVGDAVIFKNGISHTGIIESISGNTITCIEGNTSDEVARRTYSINDPKISGFVSIA